MKVWRRGAALLLAGVMTFTFLNIGPIKTTAEAKTVGAPLKFVTTGNEYGSIIAGDSIDISSDDTSNKYRIDYFKVRTAKGDGQLLDGNPAALDEIASKIRYQADDTTKGRIQLNDTVVGGTQYDELVISMRANYYVSSNEGLVTETIGGSGGVSIGDFEIEGNNTISSNSEITIRYDGNGQFSVVQQGDGIFEGYNTVAVAGGYPQKGEGGRVNLKVIFNNNTGGSNTRTVTFVSNQQVPIDTNNMEEKDPNKWLAPGTTYRLWFEAEESASELTLTVYSPQGIVNSIRDAIETPNTRDEYVIFKNGDTAQSVSTEGQNAIDLLGYLDKYKNQDIRIEWTWAPDTPAGATDEDKKAFENVITTLNTPTNEANKWMHATVNPRDDITTGTLKCKITYYDSAGSPVATSEGGLGIKILGKGIAPEMIVTQWTIGSSQIQANSRVPYSMDAYEDDVPGVPKKTGQPMAFNGRLDMGTKNKECETVKIEISNEDALSIEYKMNPTDEYQEYTGDELNNPGSSSTEVPGSIYYNIKANPLNDEQKKTGIVTDMTVTFTRNGREYKVYKYTITIIDSSPSRNNALENMEASIFESNTPVPGGLFGGSRKLTADDGFDFSPDKISYERVQVPYSYDKITFKLVRGHSSQQMFMSVDDSATPIPVINGRSTDPIELEEGIPRKIVFSVIAENLAERKYTLIVERMYPSDDAGLSVLEAFDSDAKDAQPLTLDPAFASDTPDYTLTVPYSTDRILVHVKTNYPAATVSINGNNKKTGEDSRWIKLKCELQNGQVVAGGNVTTIKIMTVAEDPNANQGVYTLRVTRDAPSKETALGNIEVFPYKKGSIDEPQALEMKPAFAPQGEAFVVTVPYSTDQVKLTATASETAPNVTIERLVGEKVKETLKSGTPSKAVKVAYATEEKPYDEIPIRVTAEDGYSQQTYIIRMERAAPNEDSSLVGIVVNGDDGAPVELSPEFEPETTSYSGSVGYAIKKVTVTVTAGFPDGATITINGKKAKSGEASGAIKLGGGGETTQIEVKVVAENENFDTTYKIKINRKQPKTDARLQALSAAPIVEDSWKPVFNPQVTDYSATIPYGTTTGVSITAVANDPDATITIDGEKAESGVPFGPMIMMDVEQTVDIVVTAEDGETSITYHITFTDQNKINYTDNVDLDSLKVKPGEMEPKFDASVTDYKVYVKEDVNSVEIIPTPADPMAKVQVFNGTKEIGDYDNNYTSAIVDGANVFKVTVTSAKPDSKKTRDYIVTVYRNDPENMGILKPLTADDINWDTSGDIINVDITKYTRVGADVFNTLRDDYPEKTIVFQGNDYSIAFKGSDLDTIVPQQTVFDFKMSFTSPEENEIYDIIDRYRENDSARIVMVYFEHHGALPATATLTLSLGHKYRNNTLYWHYYNSERDRIDYYGQVQSNSQGTFAVPLDHMSTYVVADMRLAGSENKEGGVIVNPNLSEQTSETKLNPDTGLRKKEG